MTSAVRRVTLLVGIVCLIAATGEARAAAANVPLGPDVPVIEIVLTEYAFGPSAPLINAGTFRLRILNAGIRRHNLVVQIDGVELASPDVRPGDALAWELQIERPGTYLFWCGEYRHLEKGMTGVLNVE